jgi:hypothetical protein
MHVPQFRFWLNQNRIYKSKFRFWFRPEIPVPVPVVALPGLGPAFAGCNLIMMFFFIEIFFKHGQARLSTSGT